MNKVLETHDERARKAQEHRDVRNVIERLRKAEKEVSAIRLIKASRTMFEIKARKGANTSEATAMASFTDLHVGNTITLAQMNGRNQYNLNLARSRAATFFERVVRLTKKERQDVVINDLVLFLGGDFIDGALHLDVIESNNPGEPMQQLLIAQEIIESGLAYLEKNGGFKTITIVCKDGNHSRISMKQHWNTRAGNSLEWFMFHNLARRYPQFRWVIDESFISYLRIYDWIFRFHHGDRVYFGGQNGFFSNFHILIGSDNAERPADVDVIGHLHQYTATRRYVVNGSVVGSSPYGTASRSFFKGEPPTQAYFLCDKKRRLTVNIPILL